MANKQNTKRGFRKAGGGSGTGIPSFILGTNHISPSRSLCRYLDPQPPSSQVKALSLNLREAAQALLEVLKSRSHPRAMNAREILDAVSAASPGAVADVLASSINIPTNQKQASVVSCCVCARGCV